MIAAHASDPGRVQGFVLACALLGTGCRFTANEAQPGGSDGGPLDTTPTDGVLTVDGATVSGPHVRPIEIADAQVIGGPHADFPALVALTANYLRGVGAGGEVAHPNGFDITFSADPAGTVRFAHEIERYRGDTGELVAWVKIPTLTATSVLYISYGDTTITTSQEARAAVWSAGYAAVWHMIELDDSATQNTGTNAGSVGAGGQISDARSFDGTTHLVSVAASASIDNVFANGGTAEAWFFARDGGGGGFGRLFDKGAGSTVAIGLCDANIAGGFLFGHGFTGSPGNWCTGPQTVPFEAWVHAVAVYDAGSSANDPTIYIDGEPRPVSLQSVPAGTGRSDAGATLALGNRIDSGRGFSGIIDEARLSRVTRSAGWIATSHANQRDPAAFCVVGDELP